MNVTIDEFAGNWIYRSFNNEPNRDTEAGNLLVAVADLTLEVEGAGLDLGGSRITGRVSFAADFYLTVSGTAVSGTAEPDKPPTIRYRAIGVPGTGTDGYIYDFVGYLAPSWPTAVRQRPAIVGMAIRTVQHLGARGEVRPAGETLSFIAVSRDHPAGS